jgi:hypothetical protein
MPLTATGRKVLEAHVKEYGRKKGTEVFYASINSNKRGTDKWHDPMKKKIPKKLNKYAKVLAMSDTL